MDQQSTITQIVTETAGQRHHHQLSATASLSKSVSITGSWLSASLSASHSSSLIASTTPIATAAAQPKTYACHTSKFWCSSALTIIILFSFAILLALIGPTLGRLVYRRIKDRQPTPRSLGKSSKKSSTRSSSYGSTEFKQYDRGDYPNGYDQSRLEAGPPGHAGGYGGQRGYEDEDDGYDDDDDYGDCEEGDMSNGHKVAMQGYSAPERRGYDHDDEDDEDDYDDDE